MEEPQNTEEKDFKLSISVDIYDLSFNFNIPNSICDSPEQIGNPSLSMPKHQGIRSLE